ncbi:hypothetical protein Tco_0610633 [Tanacetum coccineum]
MIQTASHLSPDAVGNIQTASPEPGLESSSIFTPTSYLIHKYFAEYNGIEVIQFRETLLQHMSNVKKSVTERTCFKRLKQDTSSRSRNDADADNADIKPIYDKEPMAEVQLTAKCNVFATGQQHAEQPEFNNKGSVDQDAEQCQVTSLLLDPSLDNKTIEFPNQSLESENICLKKTVAQFQKVFSKLEAHCIALELKCQNQSLKSGQYGQFLKEKSNEAKVKHDIDEIETINIELEHSVAKLLIENEHLNKEKEHLKQTYKDLYDSIKRHEFRPKTIMLL